MTDKTLPELANEWLAAKTAETAANHARVDIEARIIALTGAKEEGSKTHNIDNLKIEVTGVINRKMDWAAWESVKDSIPENLRPVRIKLELDETGVKYLQQNEPELYAKLPMTTKPGKTGVKVTVKAEA